MNIELAIDMETVPMVLPSLPLAYVGPCHEKDETDFDVPATMPTIVISSSDRYVAVVSPFVMLLANDPSDYRRESPICYLHWHRRVHRHRHNRMRSARFPVWTRAMLVDTRVNYNRQDVTM
jgi:hypothetical protein